MQFYSGKWKHTRSWWRTRYRQFLEAGFVFGWNHGSMESSRSWAQLWKQARRLPAQRTARTAQKPTFRLSTTMTITKAAQHRERERERALPGWWWQTHLGNFWGRIESDFGEAFVSQGWFLCPFLSVHIPFAKLYKITFHKYFLLFYFSRTFLLLSLVFSFFFFFFTQSFGALRPTRTPNW